MNFENLNINDQCADDQSDRGKLLIDGLVNGRNDLELYYMPRLRLLRKYTQIGRISFF